MSRLREPRKTKKARVKSWLGQRVGRDGLRRLYRREWWLTRAGLRGVKIEPTWPADGLVTVDGIDIAPGESFTFYGWFNPNTVDRP